MHRPGAAKIGAAIMAPLLVFAIAAAAGAAGQIAGHYVSLLQTPPAYNPTPLVGGIVHIIPVIPPRINPRTVTVSVDGAVVGSLSKLPGSVTWNAARLDGPHTVTASAKDASGAEVWQASQQITVDNAAVPPPNAAARAAAV